jgi:Leucine-rich repeat (LRR) protein
MHRLGYLVGAAFVISLVAPAAAQTYTDDSLVVRAILDSNGLTGVPVDACVSGGADCRPGSPCVPRIVELKLRGRGLRTIPASIGRLNALFSLSLDDNNLTSLRSLSIRMAQNLVFI